MGDNLIDTTKPSAGRIYDYMLGGSHNYEIDRQAAEAVMQLVPFLNKFARLQRWALKNVAEELTYKRGYDVIIDFASGLPTMNHLHEFTKPGTTIILSDIDPVVVEFSREILGSMENVHYFQNDACHPDELLNHPEVVKILNGRRKVGICYWGFSTFQNDAELSHTMQTLYDWAAPGSCLAYNAQGVSNPEDPKIKESQEIYKSMGTPFYVRTLEMHNQKVHPWKLDPGGHVSLLQWSNFDSSLLTPEDIVSVGKDGAGYGAYFSR